MPEESNKKPEYKSARLVDRKGDLSKRWYIEFYAWDEKLKKLRRKQLFVPANLLQLPEVQSFIGTNEYEEHKKKRFSTKDLKIPVSQNEALLLSRNKKEEFEKRYISTKALYYAGQPSFKTIIEKIHKEIERF